MPEQYLYNVHLFAVVRFQLDRVAADSPVAAIDAARNHPQTGRWLRRLDDPQDEGEFAEEFSHYLVDLAGDPEFRQSRWFHAAEAPLLQFVRALVQWDEGGRPPKGLENLLVEARHIWSQSR